MNTFPLFFKLEDRKVLIVGGGDVALRKADLLSRAGACITILAPSISTEIQALLSDSKHELIYENYNKAYMSGARVIIAATDIEALNHQIHADASELNIPVNVVDTPHLCDFIFPAIVDRNPIVIGISSNGKAPVLARLLRARLETLIPQGYGKLAKLAGEFRSEVKTKIPTLTGRRQFWERAFEGQVSQLMFAGNEAQATAQLKADLESTVAAIKDSADNTNVYNPVTTNSQHVNERSIESLSATAPVSTNELTAPQNAATQNDNQTKPAQVAVGEVYIVGAGPGDPELLTFKALRLMQQADIVYYDALVSPQVLDLCRRDADKVFVGKKRSNHAVAQLGINELLVNSAKEGRRVVRLKGGDPFIFGRGGEEIESLRAHGVPYQVVPGITAANAAASYAGIPLTHRDHSQSVRFVTGFLKAGAPNSNFKSFLNTDETVVFYMGLHSLARLTEGLIDAGRSSDTPIAIVSNASMPNQQVLTGTLANIVELQEQAQLPTPALLIMGDVVSLHNDLAWYNLQNQQDNQNTNDTAGNWLRGGTATTPKSDTQQQAHALSMVANLAAQQEEGLEQLVIG